MKSKELKDEFVSDPESSKKSLENLKKIPNWKLVAKDLNEQISELEKEIAEKKKQGRKGDGKRVQQENQQADIDQVAKNNLEKDLEAIRESNESMKEISEDEVRNAVEEFLRVDAVEEYLGLKSESIFRDAPGSAVKLESGSKVLVGETQFKSLK